MATKISSFRASGGDIVVHTDIIPNPSDIEIQLLQIASNLEGLRFPLAASARIARDDMQERFDNEEDPNGDKWISLDEDYLTSKQSLGYPDDILHRTGDLENAATGSTAFRIVGDSLFFDSSVLPKYGLIHQTGSGTENVGLASRHRAAVKNEPGYKDREGGSHSNTGIGRGNALPARPFIGMSEEAEGKVWDIFDLWFEKATNIAINPRTGAVQERIAGRFGPKIVL